jgi:hypothetical protein
VLGTGSAWTTPGWTKTEDGLGIVWNVHCLELDMALSVHVLLWEWTVLGTGWPGRVLACSRTGRLWSWDGHVLVNAWVDLGVHQVGHLLIWSWAGLVMICVGQGLYKLPWTWAGLVIA